MSLQFSKYEFPLTYIGDYVFEIIHENLCMDFSLGINGERMYFTKPKNPKSKVDEFVIYGVNLQGMTTFRRKNLKKLHGRIQEMMMNKIQVEIFPQLFVK